jgi:hypothetical protein
MHAPSGADRLLIEQFWCARNTQLVCSNHPCWRQVVFLDTAYRPIRLPAGEKAVFEALRQQAAAAAGGNGTD